METFLEGPRRRSFELPSLVSGGLLLLPAALTLLSCGYTLSANPPLAGGITSVSVPLVENDTAELEVGAFMADALARRAQRGGRLAGRAEEGSARLLGRIEAISSSPVAFPSSATGAGMYALSMRVRLRLLPGPDTAPISELRLAGREHYLAGADPEQTEALRRLALQRLCESIAAEAWSRLTAPQPAATEG